MAYARRRQRARYRRGDSDSLRFAPIAQLAEHRTFNPMVVGSIPTGGTKSY